MPSPHVTGGGCLDGAARGCALVLPLQLICGMTQPGPLPSSLRLVREVPRRSPDRPLTVGRVLVAMLASTMLTGMVFGPRISRHYGVSKGDIAEATVTKYAREAYPSWRNAHPEQHCPARLELLTDYMNTRDIIDPWGNDYQMFCGHHGIVVRSLGEDARANTEDDLWSNQ